jgi:hypothetical protein
MVTHTLKAAVAVATILVGVGCSGGDGSKSAAGEETIPQPALEDPRIAPANRRVDLASPTFSEPTSVSNTLFPVARQESVLLLGRVDGQPFRTEVTLLPETRFIEWQGRPVETLVSQYVAFLGGRIHEVAYDFYAQDDEGAVWYFGEDVFNFEDGVITDTHGTWLAGKDGPAAMIMPADPEVGDVYRPENIPGLVFEEVTVKAVNRTLDGPLGPVEGGLAIEELHLLDNTRERKTFGPGYGEFLTGGGGDVEALALAVPTDALSGPTPSALLALERSAKAVFAAADAKDWQLAKTQVRRMTSAWRTVRTGEVPDRLGPQMSRALAQLADGVERRNARQARQAAVDVARWSLDLQLRHRPVAEIDLARLDLWAAQMQIDAAAGDSGAVKGDFFSIDYVRDRIHQSLRPADLRELNTQLEELNGAVGDEDLPAVIDSAGRLRTLVADLRAGPES